MKASICDTHVVQAYVYIYRQYDATISMTSIHVTMPALRHSDSFCFGACSLIRKAKFIRTLSNKSYIDIHKHDATSKKAVEFFINFKFDYYSLNLFVNLSPYVHCYIKINLYIHAARSKTAAELFFCT